MPTKTTKPKIATAKLTKKLVAKKVIAPKVKKALPYTLDDVALRAYYIGEKRQQLGQPGSPEADWVEAERQLIADNAPKAKPKPKPKKV